MKKGFTLLELLIGITIFAVVCGAVYSSLYLGIRVYKNERSRNALTNQILLSFNVLEKRLYSVFIDPANEKITFKGSSERVEFFCVDRQGMLQQAGFYLEPGDASNVFELIMYTKSPREQDQEREPVIELVNNSVRSLKFLYFDPEQGQWYEDWPEELSVPGQIKAEIDFIDPGNTGNIVSMEKYISIPIANPIKVTKSG